ncbi:MAG: sugar phosphate isomerase/epimerase [Lentisphaeria bacterium]|nr:sugar phosphate isomerase/epimerase [Lentisphaeria bacterium]
MAFGLIHYNAPGDTFEAFVRYAAEAGFDCCEVMITDVWPRGAAFDPARAHEARSILDRHGVFASALTAANDFVQLDAAAVEQQVSRMRQVAELARILGTGTLRTEGGQPKEGVPEERWAEAIAGCLKACGPFCQDLGVRLAVDNHGTITNNPKVLLRALELADSPHAGSNLDTMNLRWWGNAVEDLPAIFRALAPYVFHTHMKDGTGVRGEYRGAVLGQGEIPLGVAVGALVAAGYKGVWCAEWEGRTDKARGYADCLAWMKANCPG